MFALKIASFKGIGQARCCGCQGVFRRAFQSQGRLPHKITLDGYQPSHRAAREVLGEPP
jgi:hypothetical protein